MRKGGKINYFLWIFVIVLILTAAYSFLNNFNFTGMVFAKISTPSDCSDANIKSIWDSVFRESSANILINITNTAEGFCNVSAFKKKGSEIYYLGYLKDLHVPFAYNITERIISTIHGNFTQEYANNLSNYYLTNQTLFVGAISSDIKSGGPTLQYIVPRSVKSQSEATYVFNVTYKEILPNLTNFGDVNYLDAYGVNVEDNDTINHIAYYGDASVLTNYSIENYMFTFLNASLMLNNCSPNWTRQDTGCLSNETRLIFYNDSSNCNTTTGRTADSISFCDYDSNGIIGNTSSLGAGYNFSIYISGLLLNNSLSYSINATQQFVEIKNNGSVIISFNHDFSLSPINLKNTTITLSGDNSALGYIIVNGINDSKTVYIDRKNSSNNGICVKDGAISSISDMSAYCIGNNEYIVNCSSGAYAYNCTINNNIISVSGLAHSAVREMFIAPAQCSSNWTCSNWSSCTNLIHARTCSDVNSCNTTSGSPALSESCIPSEVLPATCAPNWNCTEWTPLSCSSGENQTRVCTDIKACGTESGRPEETQECANPTNNSLILIILGVAILVIVIVAVILFTMTKKPSQPSQSPFPSQYPQPPRPIGPPVTFQPTLQERQFPPQPQQIGQYPMPRPIQQILTQNTNPQNTNPQP